MQVIEAQRIVGLIEDLAKAATERASVGGLIDLSRIRAELAEALVQVGEQGVQDAAGGIRAGTYRPTIKQEKP